MNTLVIKRGIGNIAANLRPQKPLALLAVVGLLWHADTRQIALTGLADAYYQVSIFVAATLMGLLYFERVKRQSFSAFIARHRKRQIFIAACLGAIPGCGGAIVVITQYVRGGMGFGGVVAVLTATMGDAAFLLLAKNPSVALLVFGVCFVSGVVFGHLVQWLHGRDFMRVAVDYSADEDNIEENPVLSPLYRIWMLLFVPGAVIGVAVAMQADVSALTAIGGVEWALPFGAACGLLAIAMWSFNPLSDIRLCISPKRALSRRVADTTNFITFWVLCGFVGYGVAEHFWGANIAGWLDSWVYFVPLAAVVIGFIPGCGPQVVVTTLFLNGAIPLSAQLANAISNDGDALFPAVAIAPRAAVIATLYTAAPALAVGYGWLFAFEM
jgi:hypothetical protein